MRRNASSLDPFERAEYSTGDAGTRAIEQSIMAETRRASYQEVSKYFNENDLFSVSEKSIFSR